MDKILWVVCPETEKGIQDSCWSHTTVAKVLQSTDLYLHGEQEVLHDDAVEVKEADDASHPEVAGLGP